MKTNLLSKCVILDILVIVSFIPIIFFLHSCNSNERKEWTVPSEFVGQWKTEMTKITVRTKPHGVFTFTSDSAVLTINVNNDKTASGYIGSAEFTNGKIRKNGGNPQKTGVAYIIECGSIGKIFNNDPKDAKEVEIWLGPINENRSIEAELRYTEGMAQFPMSDLLFSKDKD